jgi:hypothetical protein
MVPNVLTGFSSPDLSAPGDFSASIWRMIEDCAPKAATGLLQSLSAKGRYQSVKAAFDAGLALSTESEIVPRMNWVVRMNLSGAVARPHPADAEVLALQVAWVNAVKALPHGADEIHRALLNVLPNATAQIASRVFLAAGADPFAFTAPSAGQGSYEPPAFNALGKAIQGSPFSIEGIATLIDRDCSSFPAAAIMEWPTTRAVVQLDALEYAAWLARDDAAAVLHGRLAVGSTGPLEKLGACAAAILLHQGSDAAPLNVHATAYDEGGVITEAQVALRYIGFGACFTDEQWVQLADVRLNLAGRRDIPLAHVLVPTPVKKRSFSRAFREQAVLSLVAIGGFDVNTASSIGTLLFQAAALGLGHLAQRLLELGADPHLPCEIVDGEAGKTLLPRDIAMRGGHHDLVQIIDAWCARRRIETVIEERIDAPMM